VGTSFCNLFTRVLVDAKEIDIFWGRHEYTSFSVAINGSLVLVGTVSLFRVGCCTVYTTNNSQEFLRHYFSFRNHSFARVNQIDSCFLISYKSPLIWLGRGIRIRMGIVQYKNQQSTTVPGTSTRRPFSFSFPFLVGLCLFPFLVRFTRTYNLQTNQHKEKFKIHLTSRRT